MWNEHIFSPHNSILTTFALTRVWTEGFNHQPGRPKPQSTVGIPDETLGSWSSPLFMDLPFIPWATMAVIPISHTTGKIIWGVTCLSFIFSQSDKPADAINLRARWGIGHGSMKDRITIPNASCWLRPEREHCVNIVSTLLIFFFMTDYRWWEKKTMGGRVAKSMTKHVCFPTNDKKSRTGFGNQKLADLKKKPETSFTDPSLFI